jgi:putative ubiquitin-RnfH superfamily antitoxin RatB of RatAB toxin-antitoxin module
VSVPHPETVKRCSVACDTANGILHCELELPAAATIADALTVARAQWGEAAADWAHAAVGIYGCVERRDRIPADGDRIEIYRALAIDPRARRRARAAAAGKRRRS